MNLKDPFVMLTLVACTSEAPVEGAQEDNLRVGPTMAWHIDLENPVNVDVAADVFDIDLFDNLPEETDTIATLHAKGKKVICYFSAGTDEPARPDHGRIPPAAIGKKMADWDEYWLDVRNDGVRAVMANRIRLAKRAGCDGVDPDNVDGYANATNFPLQATDQLDFNRYIAEVAHANGLLVGLKNDTEQIAALQPTFDFAVNEQCFKYNECETERAFTRAGKSVLNIEYGSLTQLRRFCPAANQYGFFTILSARDRLDGTFERCRKHP